MLLVDSTWQLAQLLGLNDWHSPLFVIGLTFEELASRLHFLKSVQNKADQKSDYLSCPKVNKHQFSRLLIVLGPFSQKKQL